MEEIIKNGMIIFMLVGMVFLWVMRIKNSINGDNTEEASCYDDPSWF
ncbi:MAG: hypothetical protein NTY04_02190 [Candidatus Staskawiczbacteria bacterium]|nr:hypothetical protein [Candidatus Staskawiczbacteria bacterium]